MTRVRSCETGEKGQPRHSEVWKGSDCSSRQPTHATAAIMAAKTKPKRLLSAAMMKARRVTAAEMGCRTSPYVALLRDRLMNDLL